MQESPTNQLAESSSHNNFQLCTFDELIINGCWTKDVQPYGAYNLGSKWDYLDNFGYNQHYEVAIRLAQMLHETYFGTFNTSVLLQGES